VICNRVMSPFRKNSPAGFLQGAKNTGARPRLHNGYSVRTMSQNEPAQRTENPVTDGKTAAQTIAAEMRFVHVGQSVQLATGKDPAFCCSCYVQIKPRLVSRPVELM